MFFFRGFWKLIPILFGIVAGYLTALALGMVNTAAVTDAAWFTFPKFSFCFTGLDWGAVTTAVTMIFFTIKTSVSEIISEWGDGHNVRKVKGF